jgi:hypothetical protein
MMLRCLGVLPKWLPAHVWWAMARAGGSACTPTRARCSRAICLWRCKGERFDANAFLAEARVQGAVAALCAMRGLPWRGFAGHEVPDSLAALGATGHRLACASSPAADRRHRQQRQDHGDADDGVHPACLAGRRGALATQGNFNNDIGVPLTLLRLRPHHRVAVVELGMNHPGEIATWPPWPSPRWRWSTTRSASTWNSCHGAKPWRRRTAARSSRLAGRWRGGVSCRTMPTRLWTAWLGQRGAP